MMTKLLALALVALTASPAFGQTPKPTASVSVPAVAAATAPIVPPPDYVIGASDILVVTFWRHKDMTSEVTVRPDGKINLPLIDEVQAAGVTPEQLDARITEAAKRLLEDPNVTVVVKQINSRYVFVSGEVNKQGPIALLQPMTVLQAISLAGGITPYGKSKRITIIRGQQIFKFNQQDVLEGKNIKQNITLLPGDQIVVP
jgi:polysaccharide export outer membrane protein